MHKKLLIFLLVLQYAGAVFAQDARKVLLDRYRSYLRSTAHFDNDSVVQWAETLDSAGKWPDIDYADTQPAGWKTMDHLNRVWSMALAWSYPRSSLFHSTMLWKALSPALDHWLEKKYKNPNWWHNEIGVPRCMRDIIILLKDKLTQVQLAQALSVMAQLKVQGEGANLVWSADLGLHYGALTGDTALMTRCSSLISHEIKISTGEGIQPDYSFHQHGPRLQMYQYGAAFLKENIRLAWELRGTPWAFPEEKVGILADFILQGWQWMARGIHTVPSTMDRSASRGGALQAADLRTSIPYLYALFPQDSAAFRRLLDMQNGQGALQGFRYYPYSDFSVYQQQDFSFFLKTISSRTLATESINHENLKGQLLNDGDGYTIMDGKEYYNMMPVWDWKKLPGITAFDDAYRIGRKDFSGSVGDSLSGLTTMDDALFSKDSSESISAHKAWFFHDGMVVCLIAGLEADHVRGNVFTVLDQSRLQGPVIFNKADDVLGAGTHIFRKARWLYHHHIAYILLKPSDISLELSAISGSWSAINASASKAIVKDSVFLPAILHHTGEAGSGYLIAYCPDAGQAQKLAAKKPFSVIHNDADCQAIAYDDGTLMAAFFSAGEIQVSRQKHISADRPCLLYISRQSLYASDPLHKGGRINITIGGHVYTTELPTDGRTAAVEVK